MIIYSQIENLLAYAKAHLLLDELDSVYCRNKILAELKLEGYTEYEVDYDSIDSLNCPDTVLNPIVDYAVANGIITDADTENFGAKIMDIVSLKPSETADMFEGLHSRNAFKAFDWLYDYSIKNDYIKLSRIAKNKQWEAKSTKGKLEITINLSKPEKKNSDSAKLLTKKAGEEYPECSICMDNLGYAGHGMYRQNMRIVPLYLGGEEWFWQFSPYSYFNHHGIAINATHTPMKIDETTVEKLIDFVDYCPAYFIGCNAALPRIGGSILNHDHFQGGHKQLPMHKAGIAKKLKCAEYPYVETGVIDWYNSAIRLSTNSKAQLIEYANTIIKAWETYSDESVGIIANDGEQHNSVTPVARYVDGKYVLDIIFRNNSVSEEYPDGVFHAHPEYHHIKSESIGLIEAMGLFILPGRLNRQLLEIEKFLTKEVKYSKAGLSEDMAPFSNMIEKLIKENPKCTAVEATLSIKDEVNRICEAILDNTAVFKKDEQGDAAFMKFLESVNIK